MASTWRNEVFESSIFSSGIEHLAHMCNDKKHLLATSGKGNIFVRKFNVLSIDFRLTSKHCKLKFQITWREFMVKDIKNNRKRQSAKQ